MVLALIFFDLDGTILLDGEIVKGIPETIQLLKQNGHEVGIATGRNPILVGDLHQKLDIEHLVLANGGYVLSHNQLIREKYIPFATVKRMMKKADQLPFDLTIEYTDEYVAYRQDTDASLNFSKKFGLPIARYDTNVYPNRHVYAFVVFDDDAVKAIKDDFPELQFNQSGGIAYDVNFSGGLKADGVKHVVDYLGYDMKDVYAFGDNYNDMLMIQEVGHGIAMGNAVKELKEVAEYVTDDFDQEGVQKALKKYGLI
jgi:hypothetical protein